MLASSVRHIKKVTVPTKTTKSFRRSYAEVPKDLSNVKATLRTKEGPIEASNILSNKKVVIVGVPGAFTPVCSSKHIPPFVQNVEKFKKSGVDEVVVVSVNDHHVMSAWADAMASHGKVQFLADPNGEFTRAVGQEVDLTAGGLGKRSSRYCIFVENGKVLHQMVENSPGDLKETTAENMLSKLKRL